MKMNKLTKEQIDYLQTSIPEGWFKAFGKELIQDLNEAIDSENIEDFEFLEVKEKWLELRMYIHPYNERIEQIIEKYTELSRKYCLACGSPKPCKEDPYF